MAGGSYYVYCTTDAVGAQAHVPFFVSDEPALLQGLDWSGQPLPSSRDRSTVRSPEQEAIIQACQHHRADAAPQQIGTITVHPGFNKLSKVNSDSVGSAWTYSSSPGAPPAPVLQPARAAFAAHYSRSLAAAPPPPPLLSSMNGRGTNNRDSLGSDDVEQPVRPAAAENGHLASGRGRDRDPRLSHVHRTPNGSGSGGTATAPGGAQGWAPSNSDGLANGLANGHRSGSHAGQSDRSEQVPAREEPRPNGAESAAVLHALRAERSRLEAENKELRRQAAPALRLEKDLEVAESEVNAKRLKVSDLEEQITKHDAMLDALRATLRDGPMAF